MKGIDPKIKFGYTFQPDFYDDHEIIFNALIQQNKAYLDHWTKEDTLEQSKQNFAKIIMKDVFGSKPNRTNLKKFFEIPAIQALWWPIDDPTVVQGPQSDLFIDSTVLRDVIQKQSLPVKENIIYYF